MNLQMEKAKSTKPAAASRGGKHQAPSRQTGGSRHAKDDVMREVRGGGRLGALRLEQEGVLEVGGRREYFKTFTNDKWYGGTIMQLV